MQCFRQNSALSICRFFIRCRQLISHHVHCKAQSLFAWPPITPEPAASAAGSPFASRSAAPAEHSTHSTCMSLPRQWTGCQPQVFPAAGLRRLKAAAPPSATTDCPASPPPHLHHLLLLRLWQQRPPFVHHRLEGLNGVAHVVRVGPAPTGTACKFKSKEVRPTRSIHFRQSMESSVTCSEACAVGWPHLF